jgi:hypothetical protein
LLAACSGSSSNGVTTTDASTDQYTGSETGAHDGPTGTDAGSDSGGTDSATEGGGSDGGDAGANADCVAWATAECNLESTCSPGTFQQNYAKLGECVNSRAAVCKFSEAAPGTGQTAAHLQACTTAVTGASCVPTVPQPGGPCDFHGTGIPGSSCFFGHQCLSDNCDRPAGSACGKCTTEGAVGAACGGTTGVSCPADMTCDKGKCTQLVGNTQTCDATDLCVGTLSCVVTAAGATSGTCTAAGTAAGTTCNAKSIGAPDCSGPAGFHCNSTGASAGTCTANTYVQAGSACSAATFTYCDLSTCVNGTCTADPTPLAQGSACTVGAEPACAGFVGCIANADAGAPEAGASDAGTPGTCVAYAVCQ